MKWLLIIALLPAAVHADPPFYPRGTATNQALGGLNQNFLDQTTKQRDRLTTHLTPASCPGQVLVGALYNNGYTFGGTCLSVNASTNTVFTTTGTTFFSSVTINDSGNGGLLVVGDSVTAGSFFGDGSHLTGISNLQPTWKLDNGVVDLVTSTNAVVIQSGSSLTVQGSQFSVGGSTLVVINGSLGVGTGSPNSINDTRAITISNGGVANGAVDLEFISSRTNSGGRLATIRVYYGPNNPVDQIDFVKNGQDTNSGGMVFNTFNQGNGGQPTLVLTSTGSVQAIGGTGGIDFSVGNTTLSVVSGSVLVATNVVQSAGDPFEVWKSSFAFVEVASNGKLTLARSDGAGTRLGLVVGNYLNPAAGNGTGIDFDGKTQTMAEIVPAWDDNGGLAASLNFQTCNSGGCATRETITSTGAVQVVGGTGGTDFSVGGSTFVVSGGVTYIGGKGNPNNNASVLALNSSNNFMVVQATATGTVSIGQLGFGSAAPGSPGTAVLTWTDGSKVGIGTSNPDRALRISDSANDGVGLSKGNDSLASGGYVSLFARQNAASRDWVLASDFSTFGDFAIVQSTGEGSVNYNTTPWFYITPSGNVEIGRSLDIDNAKTIIDDEGSLTTYRDMLHVRQQAGDNLVMGFSTTNDYIVTSGNPLNLGANNTGTDGSAIPTGIAEVIMPNASTTFLSSVTVAGSGLLGQLGFNGSASGATTFAVRQGIVGVSNGGFSIRDIADSINSLTIDANDNVSVPSSMTASAFFGDGSHLTGISQGGASNTWQLSNGNVDLVNSTNTVTVQSTITVQGSAFSVGTSSFTVKGGTVTVAYGFTATNVTSTSSSTASAFFGDGSHLTGINITPATQFSLFLSSQSFSSVSSFNIGFTAPTNSTVRCHMQTTAWGTTAGYPQLTVAGDGSTHYYYSNYGYSANGFVDQSSNSSAFIPLLYTPYSIPATASGASDFDFNFMYSSVGNFKITGTAAAFITTGSNFFTGTIGGWWQAGSGSPVYATITASAGTMTGFMRCTYDQY